MVKFRKKYDAQVAKLEEDVKFQAGRRKLLIDDDDVFDMLLEEGMEDFSPDPEAENGEAIYERRMLCVSVVNLAIARTADTESEVIDALCFGNWLVGCLGFVPDHLANNVCASCIIKNFSSKNGELGAIKRHAPMRDLEHWAVKQYESKEWPSANKAAHDLMENIIAHGRTIGAKLEPQNAQRTIAGWFRKSKNVSV